MQGLRIGAVALVFVGGCFIHQGPALVVEYAALIEGPRPAVAAEAVQVYLDSEAGSFPEGVTRARVRAERLRDRIVLEPGFPTAGDAHQMLGGLRTNRRRGENRQEAFARLAAEAGRHGANGIVVLEVGHQSVTALAFHFSSAQPVYDFPAAEQVLAELDKEDGYRSAAQHVQSLDRFQPIVIDGRRGRCYRLRLALGTDAQLSRHARRGLGLRYQSGDREVRATRPNLGLDLPMTTRGFRALVGCPQADGPIEVDLWATFGSAGAGERVHELGTGAFVIEILSKRISRQELARRSQRAQQRWDDAAQSNRDYARRNCGRCNGALLACGDDDPYSCDRYRHCLSRHSLRVQECVER